MDLGQWIIIGVCAVMGLWYIYGSFVNKNRGGEIFNWLRSGLETFGKVSQARWIGSSGSGAQLLVKKANKPLRQIDALFLLDSREILPLWLFNLLRGKRDDLILKVNLRSIPPLSIEVAKSGHRDIRKLLSNDLRPPFEPISTSGNFEIIRRGSGGDEFIDRLQSFIEKYPEAIQRLSLQRQEPHLILRLDLPPLRETNMGDFLSDLITWLQG